MLRMRMFVLGLMIVVLCGITLLAAAQDAKENEGSLCIPIGNIVLEPMKSVESKKSSVEFPHSRHFIYNCKECHHKWNQDAQLQTCATSDCHDLAQAPHQSAGDGIATIPAIKYFKKAFHQKCIGCHRQIKMQNAEKEKSLRLDDKMLILSKTGPTGCIQCHPKE